MHVLVIPSWYQNKYQKMSGIFFKEQTLGLLRRGYKVGIINVNLYSLKLFFPQRVYKYPLFGKKKYIDEGILTFQYHIPGIPKMFKLNKFIKLRAFKKIFKKYISINGEPDIVHLHSFMSGDLAIWLSENYNIPFVYTEHLTTFARNLIKDKELDFAKQVAFQSKRCFAVSNEFVSLLKDKLEAPFEYLPNFINTEFFKCESKEISKEKFTFINIGFMDKKKNQEMLIKVFSEEFRNKKNVELIIIGGGVLLDELKYFTNKLGMDKQIHILGQESREVVKSYLCKSDCFVLTSTYETFGVVLIEAMSCGLPVISTPSGGPESIILDDKIGMLCGNDENSLRKAMKKVFLGGYDKEYIRNYVIERFSEEAVIQKIDKIYRDVIKKS